MSIHARSAATITFAFRLYTMKAYDWTERYPRIVEEAARLKASAILDCESGLHGRARSRRLRSAAQPLL
jgi:hypothetical protein